MPAKTRKRSRSGFEGHDKKPSKFAKVDESKAIDSLAAANARVSDLEQQIRDLHAFLNATGMTRKAPKSIQKYMNHQPDAAKILAGQIKTRASQVYEELCEETYDARKSGVTSDDISQAMVEFLDEVEDLRKLPDSVAVAFDLVMFLAAHSYGELDGGGCGCGDRPSDEDVDRLLCELALERRSLEPSWDFAEVLKKLNWQAEELGDYGIEDFCSSTIELLEAWQDDLPANIQTTSSKKG